VYPCMRARPAPRGSSVPRAARASSSAGGPSDRRPSGRSRRRCTFGGPASSRAGAARAGPRDRGRRTAPSIGGMLDPDETTSLNTHRRRHRCRPDA